MGSRDDAALRRSGHDDLDRVTLRLPVDRQPPATLRAQDQRARLLADEGQSVRIVERAGPDAQVQLLELEGQFPDIYHDTDHREAEQLLTAAAARPAALV